ncbi:MAG: Ohr family peroxiredoxin [Verrucomicrobiota bacterium]
MKTLFTVEAVSKGGRSGTIQTPDSLLSVTLGNPLEKGAEKRGPSPELLFAGAYSAGYHGALSNAAKKLGTPVEYSTVRALVSLIEDDQGDYRLEAELYAQLPGIDRAQAQRIMDEAHKTCPYSKALRGGTAVKLMVDWPANPARRVRRGRPPNFTAGLQPTEGFVSVT